MTIPLAELRTHDSGLLELALNRPEARNALSIGTFDAISIALDAAADELERRSEATDPQASPVLLLTGRGRVFCSGFDLAAAVERPELMAEYVNRLSETNRRLRRLPAVVVAAVQRAAIAGGCALLGACDFVFVEASASLGYPAHRIGISPAVTIPTLRLSVGDGAARELLLGGRIIDGHEAWRCGMASHVVDEHARCVRGINRERLEAIGSRGAGPDNSDEVAPVQDIARRWCEQALLPNGPRAVQATKQWLNSIEGTTADEPFDHAASGSTSLCEGEEAINMLRAYWAAKTANRR